MKHLTLLTSLFFFFLCTTAQTTSKTVATKGSPELPKLLMGIGLPYKVANDSLAVIPYGGENLASFNVYIQKIGDLYIVYSSLSESLPGKLSEANYKYLLQQNEKYDIIKIGMSGENNEIFLRADVYKMGITTSMLKRIIVQVANVTNIIAGEIK